MALTLPTVTQSSPQIKARGCKRHRVGGESFQGEANCDVPTSVLWALHPQVNLVMRGSEAQPYPSAQLLVATTPGVVGPGEAIGEEEASPHEGPSDQGEDQGPGALRLLSLTAAGRGAFLHREAEGNLLGAQWVLSSAGDFSSISDPDTGYLQDPGG